MNVGSPKGLPIGCSSMLMRLSPEPEEQRRKVLERLDEIDMDSPVESVVKAGRKVRRLARGQKSQDLVRIFLLFPFFPRFSNSPLQKSILTAVSHLESRLAPIIPLYASSKAENASLHTRVQELSASLHQSKALARRLKEIAEAEKKEASRHQERAVNYFSVVKQREAEVEELKGVVEEKDKKVGVISFI